MKQTKELVRYHKSFKKLGHENKKFVFSSGYAGDFFVEL